VAPLYHRWVFECTAPVDEFGSALRHALTARGVVLGRARAYDASVRQTGARGWFRVETDGRGVALVVKVRGGLFGGETPGGRRLAAAILDAGREAQKRMLWGPGGREREPAAPRGNL
jgi:hypothetical protein